MGIIGNDINEDLESFIKIINDKYKTILDMNNSVNKNGRKR